VAKLPALQTLVLNGTDVTGTLQPIASIPRLQTLDLSRSSVKDDDLTALTGLTNLRTLMLNDTDITDAAAPLIAQLSGVRPVR
jgi:Leucine-rich repeat (LRR) protein